MTTSYGRPETMHLIAEDYQRRVDQGVKDAQARNPELWHLLDKLRTPSKEKVG